MAKQKRKYVLKLRAKIMLTLLFLGYFLFLAVEQEAQLNNQQSEMDSLQQSITQVHNDNEMLNRQIEYTRSDEYIEKAARSRLGWVKDDEIIFIEKEE